MAAGKTRIGVVGSGFISRGFLLASASHADLTVSKVLTRRSVVHCQDFPNCDLLTNSTQELIDHSDVVVEASGDVLHATDVISRVLKAHKPVVTLNAEFHVTTGSYFCDKGLLTESEGDQPGCLAALKAEAEQMGFRPLVYANVKSYQNWTPTAVEMNHWSKKQGISLKMVTAATDGTKLQFEQALIANGLGADILKPGLSGLRCCSLRESAQFFAREAKLRARPISDYIIAEGPSPRVFLVAEHDREQQAALEYFKLGEGPCYLLPRETMLGHLEIAKTVRRIVRGGDPLLNNSRRPSIGVAAVAKIPLAAGHRIEKGSGSFEVRGVAVPISDFPDHLPMGLVADVHITKPIKSGDYLTVDNTSVPDTAASRAWAHVKDRVFSHDRRIASHAPHASGGP